MINANEAKNLSKENLKTNKEFKQFVKYTEDEIIKAIKNGERKCIMHRKYDLLPSLIKYFENLGYTVKTNIPPYIESYYLFW